MIEQGGVRTRRTRLTLFCALGLVLAVRAALHADAKTAPTARPLLITVDDLPLSAGRLHPDPAERERITRGLLAALGKHHIQAVGLVTWNNLRDPREVELLDLWLQGGHELGNHSYGHLNFSATDAATYLADVERARLKLDGFLALRGRKLRFFRFPFLREGNTIDKLRAMRDYLAKTSQRNLTVTIDNQDWSFEEPWVRARAAGDAKALRQVADDYQAAMRLHVRHHEESGDHLLGRAAPQVLLLHATEVSAAQWDALFTWLEGEGHRFASADEVLGDPAFTLAHEFVGEWGFSLWDRLAVERRREEVTRDVTALLEKQAADWNRGDLAAFCSVYDDSATFVAPSGSVQGREAVLARYRKKYPDKVAMGTLSFEVAEVRLAAGNEVSLFGDAVPSRVHGASVIARWRLAYSDHEAASGVTLLVLKRAGSGWSIVQDASTP